MKRLHALVALLQSRNDVYPTPKGANLASAPGPGIDDKGKAPCGCARLTHVMRRVSREVVKDGQATRETRLDRVPELSADPNCLWCRGSGWRRRLRKLDGENTGDESGALWDAYTYPYDRNTKAGVQELRCYTRDEARAELTRLRNLERLRAGALNKRDAYGWELAKKRRDRDGSHPELERALDNLRQRRPGLHGLLTGYYCENRYSELSPEAHFALGRALIALARHMPQEIRVPQHLSDARNGEARSAQVVSIFRAKGSVTATARATGLRRGKVRYVLRRAGALE